ncbi:hypothetical protein [Bremerella cremea]|uniref:hypothetical protein n=1 Tax=Bremerella cremea TaxID=1031537 RepID=UPI0031E8D3C6
MQSSNDFPSSSAEKPDNLADNASTGCQHRSATNWMMKSAYGIAGLVMLALIITVVSPETAVAVSRYLPENVQQSFFAATSTNHRCCGKGPRTNRTVPVSTGASCSLGEGTCPADSCCPMDMPMTATGADFMQLSLDEMLAGVDAAPAASP